MARTKLEEWYRYLESQFEAESPSDGSPKLQASPTPANSVSEPDGEATASSSSATPQVSALVSSAPPTRPLPPEPSSPTEAGASGSSYGQTFSIRVPHIFEFLPMLRPEGEPVPNNAVVETEAAPNEEAPRLRKRKRRPKVAPEAVVPPEIDAVWAKLPQYLRYLAEWTDDSVTRKYYPARIRESREELIARLTDPVLTLEETARLLGVCPATIRRYTDRGWLRHFRTGGNQRRFRLSDIVAFLEEQASRRPLGNRNANRPTQEDPTEEL